MKRLLCLVTGLGLLLASGAFAADAVKIGLMGPMTGAWASEGQEMRQVVGLLGRTGINIVTRLMGLIMAAMGVEFIANGLRHLFPVLGG